MLRSLGSAIAAAEAVAKAPEDLVSMAEAEGLSVLGAFRVGMKSMTPTPDQRMSMQLLVSTIE